MKTIFDFAMLAPNLLKVANAFSFDGYRILTFRSKFYKTFIFALLSMQIKKHFCSLYEIVLVSVLLFFFF
jgi:hypothetical protein